MNRSIVYLILVCFLIGCEKESEIINDTPSANEATYELASKFACPGNVYNPATQSFEQVDKGILCDPSIPFFITGTTTFPQNNLGSAELEVKLNSENKKIQGILDIDWSVIGVPHSGSTASFGINVGTTFSPIKCVIQWVTMKGCIYQSTIVFDLKFANQTSLPNTYLEGSEVCQSSQCYALQIINGNNLNCSSSSRLDDPLYISIPIDPNSKGTLGGGTYAVIVP